MLHSVVLNNFHRKVTTFWQHIDNQKNNLLSSESFEVFLIGLPVFSAIKKDYVIMWAMNLTPIQKYSKADTVAPKERWEQFLHKHYKQLHWWKGEDQYEQQQATHL